MTGCTEETLEAVNRTRMEIHRLKQKMRISSDSEEKYRLKCRLKELRQLQFQQIEQLG